MQAILNRVRTFIQSEDGPTATEYAIMLGLIILVAIVAVTSMGKRVNSSFASLNTAMETGGMTE